MKSSSRTALLLVALFLFSVVSGRAEFAPPQSVPLSRLLNNADAYLAKNRDQAEAYYILARIHYLAFFTKREHLLTYAGSNETDGKPNLDFIFGERTDSDDPDKIGPDALSKLELIAHASQAALGFNEALRRAPKKGLYALGLASLLDEFRRWNKIAKVSGVPPELQSATIRRVREAYAEAFSLAMAEYSKLKEQLPEGIQGIVANESAAALIRLAKDHPDSMTEEDKRRLKRAEEAVAKFEKLRMGIITPIVFSLHPAAHLDELLDPARTVDFDLRGYGPRERWPWVKAELGFLVWDPLETGCIESARQMFGSYTFQIFRRTGYDALAALDDNADGILSGPELAGLSVWFDRDGDGRSTAGEVIPLRTLGVESIAVTATTRDGIHPANPRGLTLRDGRTLPTWDWIVEPVR